MAAEKNSNENSKFVVFITEWQKNKASYFTTEISNFKTHLYFLGKEITQGHYFFRFSHLHVGLS